MTVPEFIKLTSTIAGMRKTEAVELVAKITGQSIRSAWTQSTGSVRTPAPISRLLDIYCAQDIPEAVKKKHFPEVYS